MVSWARGDLQLYIWTTTYIQKELDNDSLKSLYLITKEAAQIKLKYGIEPQNNQLNNKQALKVGIEK